MLDNFIDILKVIIVALVRILACARKIDDVMDDVALESVPAGRVAGEVQSSGLDEGRREGNWPQFGEPFQPRQRISNDTKTG